MSEASKPHVDYTAMDAPTMLAALGDDGMKWAEAFCQHHAKHKFEIDESLMVGWFANAIEHSHDTRRWRMEKAARGDAYLTPPPINI